MQKDVDADESGNKREEGTGNDPHRVPLVASPGPSGLGNDGRARAPALSLGAMPCGAFHRRRSGRCLVLEVGL